MSGSAVGTITERYFELSGDHGRRIHFTSPEKESAYHRKERAKIAASLQPLAAKIKALLERLRKKEPWSNLIQVYQPEAGREPGVGLVHFEMAAYGPWLQQVREKGPYLYTTSFGHRSAKGSYLSVTIRFLFAGEVEPASLYELEDSLHKLRTPLHKDRRHAANPTGAELVATGCDTYLQRLERLRAAFTARLRKKKLLYQGHADEGTPFSASLEGPGTCLASFEILMAGRHHWGRTRLAFIQAARETFSGAREWPGAPHDPAADTAPWRIVLDPGVY